MPKNYGIAGSISAGDLAANQMKTGEHGDTESLKKKMIGQRVKWMTNWDWRFGAVVAENGDWFVVKVDSIPAVGTCPFLIKHGADIVLA